MNGTEATAAATEQSTFALLVVANQTFSKEQKDHVLQKISSSLSQINDSSLLVNLEEELNYVMQANPFEPQSFDKEYRVVLTTANFNFELLINSTLYSFKRALRTFLQCEYKTKTFVYAGVDLNVTSLVFQDSLFNYDDLHAIVNEADVQQSLANTAVQQIQFTLNSNSHNNNWKNLEKLSTGKSVFKLLAGSPAVAQGIETNSTRTYENFVNYLTNFFNEQSIVELMEETKLTGALNLERPALYIFPAREGDCSFFSFTGYSMLIDGGYDRTRPCFWEFASMLKQVDAVLLTHTDADALGGLSSFFAKKLSEPNVKPNVLSVFGNLVGNTDTDVVLEAVDKLKLKHLPLVKNEVLPLKPNHQPERVNLYYKLGYGSLDMFVLSPFANSNEYKEFLHQTSAKVHTNVHKSQLNVNNTFKDVPITHLCSAVVLLTWTPSRANESVLRMLFTGNAPQHVIANALEKVKEFDVLKTAVYKVKAEAASVIKKPVPAPVKTEAPVKAAAAKPTNGAEKPASAPVATTTKPAPVKPVASATNTKPAAVSAKPPVAAAASVDGVKKVEKKVEPKRTSVAAASAKDDHVKEEKEVKKSVKAPVVKKEEVAKPKPEPTAAAKPPVVNASKSEHNTKATGASTTAATVPKGRPSSVKPVAKPEKVETEKKEAAKKPQSAPVKPISKAAPKPPKPTKEKAQGDKPTVNDANLLATRLVAEVSEATASTISTVPHKESQNGDADQHAKKPTGFLTSIKDAWDTATTFGRKKSTPSEEVAVATSTPTTEAIVTEEQQVVAVEQSQSQEEEEVFEAREDNCEVTRKDVDVLGSEMDNQVETVESAGCNDENEYELVENVPHDEDLESNAVQSEDCNVVSSNDDVLQDRSALSEDVEQEQEQQQQLQLDDEQEEQEVVCEDIPQDDQNDEDIEDVPIEECHAIENTVDHAYQSDLSDRVEELPQQHNEYIEPIENVLNEEDRDVIDPTEVEDNSPHLSPVKGNGSKDSMDIDEHVDAIVEIIQDVEQPQEQEEPQHDRDQLNLDLHQQAHLQPQTYVVDDAKDLIQTPTHDSDVNTPVVESVNRQDEDVMTRSFIDDGENRNPFEPIVYEKDYKSTVVGVDDLISNLKSLNFEKLNGEGEHVNGHENDHNGHYTNGNSNGHHTNGDHVNGGDEEVKRDLLLDGLTSEYQPPHHVESPSPKQQTPVNINDPSTWNLLELPTPVNPNDAVVDVATPATTTLNGTADKKATPNSKKPNNVQSSPAKQQQIAAVKPPATLNSSFSNKTTSSKTGKPVHPYYFDVTYVPAHGNAYYVDSDFFKRVRSRYYVLSTIEPTQHVLNALIEGKQTWEDKELQVSLIPTYETDVLRHWFTVNNETLTKLKIDVQPAANHSTLTIDNNPNIAYQVFKLEF